MMKSLAKIDKLRDNIMRVAIKNEAGHIASSLSCLDILAVLYYDIIEQYDTVILSKGHGCYGLYAIWADIGLLSNETWENFEIEGCLKGYGSLGHGLPIAVGIALANKLQKNDKHVWVIVGDGELQEGSCWEALAFAFHHSLINLTIIVDNNKLQAMDKVKNIQFCDLGLKFNGFGYAAIRCDGHDHKVLYEMLKYKPSILIADTIKGNGINYMANKPEWHYRVPTSNEYNS